MVAETVPVSGSLNPACVTPTRVRVWRGGLEAERVVVTRLL